MKNWEVGEGVVCGEELGGGGRGSVRQLEVEQRGRSVKREQMIYLVCRRRARRTLGR